MMVLTLIAQSWVFTGHVNNTPQLVSAHPSGVLTLEYVTDDGPYDDEGFYGTVTCVDVLASKSFSATQTEFSPNPVTDFVAFKSAQTIKSIKIIDMPGRIIQQETVGTKTGVFNMTGYASGHYLAVVDFDNSSEVIRIIKN